MSKNQMDTVAAYLHERMRQDSRVVVLTADLVGSCRLSAIEADYPDRFINVSIAEQNMLGIAAGLAREGVKPYAFTFSVFATLRAAEQLRTDILYNGLDVKVIGTHGGLSTGQAGSTHFSLEDIGVMRAMPESRVVVPADAASAASLLEALDDGKPVFMRLDRNDLPEIYTAQTAPRTSDACLLRQGKGIALLACGAMVAPALDVAETLDATLLDIHTVKPIDYAAIAGLCAGHHTLVTVEEHNTTGGLGSAVAEVLAGQGDRAVLHRIGIPECYPKGGPVEANRRLYGLDAEGILQLIRSKTCES